jgi:hypothetical protein
MLKFCLLWLTLLVAGQAWAAPAVTADSTPATLDAPYGAPAAAAPDTVATEVYNWYLDTLAADQDPLSDRYATITGYVGAALTARLVERVGHGPPPASDYFIQAADYRLDWRSSVHAAVVRQGKGTAEVRLTLGREARLRRTLCLEMALEDGRWKIRSVARVSDDVDESSMEPSGI